MTIMPCCRRYFERDTHLVWTARTLYPLRRHHTAHSCGWFERAPRGIGSGSSGQDAGATSRDQSSARTVWDVAWIPDLDWQSMLIFDNQAYVEQACSSHRCVPAAGLASLPMHSASSSSALRCCQALSTRVTTKGDFCTQRHATAVLGRGPPPRRPAATPLMGRS